MNSSAYSTFFSSNNRRRSMINLHELAIFTKPSVPSFSLHRVAKPQKKKSPAVARTEILQNYLVQKQKFQKAAHHSRKSLTKLRTTSQLSSPTHAVDPPIQQMISEVETKSVKSSSRHSLFRHPPKLQPDISSLEPDKPFNFRYLIFEITRKRVAINFKAVISQLLEKIQLLNRLSIRFDGGIIFNNKPFQKPFSYEFIQACKTGDIIKIKELLKVDKYLVFSFDYIHQTGLHWAVKRNHPKVVQYILQLGCDVDQVDLIGRPAMFFAVENCNYDCVKALLEHSASPWSLQRITYSKLCQENHRIMFLLNKARKFHVIFKLVNAKQRVHLRLKMLKGAFDI